MVCGQYWREDDVGDNDQHEAIEQKNIVKEKPANSQLPWACIAGPLQNVNGRVRGLCIVIVAQCCVVPKTNTCNE